MYSLVQSEYVAYYENDNSKVIQKSLSLQESPKK